MGHLPPHEMRVVGASLTLAGKIDQPVIGRDVLPICTGAYQHMDILGSTYAELGKSVQHIVITVHVQYILAKCSACATEQRTLVVQIGTDFFSSALITAMLERESN